MEILDAEKANHKHEAFARRWQCPAENGQPYLRNARRHA